MEGDDDVDMAAAENNETELDDMKRRLKDMEDEAAALRDMQAKVEKEMGAVQDPAAATTSQANREEVDSRSIFVGNVSFPYLSYHLTLHNRPSLSITYLRYDCWDSSLSGEYDIEYIGLLLLINNPFGCFNY